MAAAFQQANDASFFVRIGYAIDDPEFLAAREGGFVVQNEQGVVEGLALRCRGSRSADDPDKHEVVLRLGNQQSLVGLTGSADTTPDITLLFDLAFGRNQNAANARPWRFEVLPRSLELETYPLPGGSPSATTTTDPIHGRGDPVRE